LAAEDPMLVFQQLLKNLMKYWTVLIVLLISCSQKKEEEKLMSYEVSIIKIPIFPPLLNSYMIYDNYTENEKNWFVGYNDINHSLDFFDLDQQLYIKKVELAREGPNGVGNLLDFKVVNSDSLILYEFGRLHFMNESHQLKRTVELGEYFHIGQPIYNFYFKMILDDKRKKIFFYLRNNSEQLDQHKIGFYNLNKEVFEPLEIGHNEYYKKSNGNLGFISYLGSHGLWNNSLLFNYQYESSLYLYDFDKSKLSHYSGVRGPDPYKVEPLRNQDDFERHALTNSHFLTPVPDLDRRLIYQLVWGPPKTSDQFVDKTISLKIFDENLTLKEDILLPDRTYQINNTFVNKNGLHLNPEHPLNGKTSENWLVFHVYSFKRE
jgi:hypothetical protein